MKKTIIVIVLIFSISGCSIFRGPVKVDPDTIERARKTISLACQIIRIFFPSMPTIDIPENGNGKQ